MLHEVRSFKQERARVAADLRAAGKTRVDVAEVFRHRYGVNGRVAMRWTRGWSQRDVADAWCQRWPDDLKVAKNISYWETWPQSGHAPTIRTLDRLAQLYGCDIADLLADLPGYRDLCPDDELPVPAVVPPIETAAPAAAVAYPAIPRPISAPTSFEPSLVEPPSKLDVLAAIAMADAFRAADRRLGGGVLYAQVLRFLNHDVAPNILASGDATTEAGLTAVAAHLMDAAGWMAYDSGDEGRAFRHFSRAFELASRAGESVLVATVCASMSHLASSMGQGIEATRLARVGLRHVERAPGAARLEARLHAMTAKGLAGEQQAHACRAALDRAELALAADDESNSEWIGHFDDGTLAGDAASCHLLLTDLGPAEYHARRAVALRGGDRIRSRALARLTLAHALAAEGEVDESAGLGIAVCEAAQALSSTQVERGLDRLQVELGQHTSVERVGDFIAARVETRRSASNPAIPMPWPT